MNPGKLDILATIQYDAGTTKTSAGTPVRSWTTYKTLWVSKVGSNAVEPVAGSQVVSLVTEEFKYRTTDGSGITAKMRLKVGTEYWDIVQPVYIDRMYSKLICTRRDND
jgi:head-tail adaptor